MNYVPLNIKTHYELLSSLIDIDSLINFALKNKIDYLGITDSKMFGTVEFYNKCIKNGISPIIGTEIIFLEYKFLLYSKNYNGYKNLCILVSNEITLELLEQYSNDLICVTDLIFYEKLKDIYEEIFIKYNTTEQKLEASLTCDNIVYVSETNCFEESDNEYLSYLSLIRDGKTINNISQYSYSNELNKNISLMDAQTTYSFAKSIDFKLPSFTFDLPKYCDNDIELITNLCKKGLIKRLDNKITKQYIDRLKYELDVIIKMGYVDYFLIVYDFVLYAKKNNILVGPGRGSAAGSLVSYVLGITEVDPIKYNLIFERFLNVERVSMPDIDIDLEYLKREKVIEYVKNKYGLDKVANIITFGTLLPKQVLRDVGRILEIPINEIDKITKLIKDKESFVFLQNNKQFLELINSKKIYTRLFDISKKLENLKRHTSIHAAGVVLSSEPLTNKMPLIKSGSNTLTGYTMEYMEQLGLLKIDFLALRNLTIIDNVLSLIKEQTGKTINLNFKEYNDPRTLELFKNADTIGIFQFESESMRAILRVINVNSFEDIIASNALNRPGARESTNSFAKRKSGKEKIEYLHPLLEPILSSTYGIIIYQEQVLEILKTLGNFSYSKADDVRRAMSKKKEEVIIKYKEEFKSGCIKNNIEESISEYIYNLVLKFANYGFNKSHSVAYSMIAYKQAYLKSNYKEFYMANLFNIVIGNEIKTKEYIDEARILHVELVNPNINESSLTYLVNECKIIFPLGIIKNVGKEGTNYIIEERSNGKYKDYLDFIKRTYNEKVNVKTIESLILSGSLDTFNETRKTMIENLNEAINYAKLCKDLDETLVMKPDLVRYSEYLDNELMDMEYKLFGFYIKNHPVTKFKRTLTLNNIEKYFDKTVIIIGLVESIKEIVTKNKEKMAFLTISDEYKKINVVLFPRVYVLNYSLEKGNVVSLNGKVEKRMGEYQIIANKIENIKN